MRSDKLSRMKLKSWTLSLVYFSVWLIVTIGLKVLSDDVLGSILLHVAYLMILLPAATLCITYLYTHRCGIKPWLIAEMTAAALILYFFFGYNELSPDFIVICLICAFFGFGVGNVLKNETAVAVQEDIDSKRKKEKLAEENKYVPLLNADPKTGKAANIRKQDLRSQTRGKNKK